MLEQISKKLIVWRAVRVRDLPKAASTSQSPISSVMLSQCPLDTKFAGVARATGAGGAGSQPAGSHVPAEHALCCELISST